MRVTFEDNGIVISDFSFECPTVGAIEREDSDLGTYYFCLKSKIAILIHKNRRGKQEVVSQPIKIKNNELWIKYDKKREWEIAGPVSQDKYKIFAFEEALRKIR